MAEIHVDYRESALIAELKSREPAPWQVVVGNLEVGDVQITHPSGLLLVFERKTVADLAASVKDGRYKEQKLRMMSTAPAHRITYIIEGGRPIMHNTNGMSSATYDGVVMNTMYRDGIHILFVDDVKETAQWICKLATRCHEHPEKLASKGGEEYHAQCKAKTRKIDNITPRTCYLLQLSQIPGVSKKIAEVICDTYPCMSRLLHTLTASASPELELAKLPLIGAKKAKLICEYMLHHA